MEFLRFIRAGIVIVGGIALVILIIQKLVNHN